MIYLKRYLIYKSVDRVYVIYLRHINQHVIYLKQYLIYKSARDLSKTVPDIIINQHVIYLKQYMIYKSTRDLSKTVHDIINHHVIYINYVHDLQNTIGFTNYTKMHNFGTDSTPYRPVNIIMFLPQNLHNLLFTEDWTMWSHRQCNRSHFRIVQECSLCFQSMKWGLKVLEQVSTR